MFVVKITNAGGDYYMRRTIWTGDPARADRFETEEAAREKLQAIRRFTKPKDFKVARIVEAD